MYKKTFFIAILLTKPGWTSTSLAHSPYRFLYLLPIDSLTSLRFSLFTRRPSVEGEVHGEKKLEFRRTLLITHCSICGIVERYRSNRFVKTEEENRRTRVHCEMAKDITHVYPLQKQCAADRTCQWVMRVPVQ